MAHSTQKTTHEAFDPKIRAARQALRKATTAEQAALNNPNNDGGGNGPLLEIPHLRDWVFQAKRLVWDYTSQRDAEVKAIWHEVIKTWEGGVREIIKDDGTGQGLELCRFKFVYVDPLEEKEAVTATAGGEGGGGGQIQIMDNGQQGDSALQPQDGWNVDIEWTAL